MRPVPSTGRPRRKRRTPGRGELSAPGHPFEDRSMMAPVGRRDIFAPSPGGPGRMP